MNNNVLVTVHGLQHEIDDKEGIQTKQTGNYRLVAGKHIYPIKNISEMRKPEEMLQYQISLKYQEIPSH